MRQAIKVRFHGPTNTRPSRFSATTDAGRRYYARDDSLSVYRDAARVAELHARHMDWPGLYSGAPIAPDVFAFVQSDCDGFTVFACERCGRSVERERQNQDACGTCEKVNP